MYEAWTVLKSETLNQRSRSPSPEMYSKMKKKSRKKSNVDSHKIKANHLIEQFITVILLRYPILSHRITNKFKHL